MTIITDYKLPENNEEIQANRVKFVKALLNEDPKDQCRGQLFEYPVERGLIGEAAKEAKHRRCALGVAATVFFNINTGDDLDNFCTRSDDENLYGYDVADEIGKMLNIPYGSNVMTVTLPVTLCAIIEANDDEEMSFSAIGTGLQEKWELKLNG